MVAIVVKSIVIPVLYLFRGSWFGFLILLCFALLLYYLIYMPLMPNPDGFAAHDWVGSLPRMLSGFYWYLENGPWSLQWFMPGHCGGYFNGIGLSLPQLITYFFSPVYAFRLIFIAFASIGYIGFYFLARKGFRFSRYASFLVAMLYLFNGFYSHRMIVGHIFYSDMLFPLIALLCLRPVERGCYIITLLRLIFVGYCFGYMAVSLSLEIMPATIIGLSGVLCLNAALHGWRWSPWLFMGFGGIFGIMLSLQGMMALVSLLQNFPRNYYPLPGINGLFNTARLVLDILFFSVPESASKSIVNSQWLLDRHEWEYGVTPVPLIVIGLVLLMPVYGRKGVNPRMKCSLGKVLGYFGFSVACIIPIIVNWYSPGWNAFLKSMPYFDTASNLLRLLVALIPLVLVYTAARLDGFYKAMGWRISQKALCTLLLVIFGVCWVGFTDRSFYYQQLTYDARTVDKYWHQAKQSHLPPPITDVQLQNNVVGNGPEDAFMAGVTTIACYEPTMGYRLEKFPVGPLHPGPVFGEQGAEINLKNPACYLYPEENNCKPGDHFRPDQRAEAEAFARYWPFEFKFSQRQIWANRISFYSFWGSVLTLFLLGTIALVRRFWPR